MKLKLSKTAQTLFDESCLGWQTSKLCGEFAGVDVPLLPGQTYSTIRDGGGTYLRTDHLGELIGIRLGSNCYIHRWKIIRRTPCSYVAVYKHTSILCDGMQKYVYAAFLPQLMNRTQRFFPLRTRRKPEQFFAEQTHFKRIPPGALSVLYNCNTDDFLVKLAD